MTNFPLVIFVFTSLWLLSACSNSAGKISAEDRSTPVIPIDSSNSNSQNQANVAPPIPTPSAFTTTSPIGKFDFKNYTYPLPKGWQGELDEITLENGKAPLSMEDDARKIGASFVSAKFGDVTGDGKDEAFITLKIETGGSAVPQTVYIFEWKNDKPDLIWHFRTGDRADGGLKDVRAENAQLVIELFGQDRFIFGEVETMKIMGDEENLCCPTWFTQTRLKWNGRNFQIQGKRLTYSIDNPTAPPIENMGDIKAEEQKKNRK